jgi:DNA-directed RNA polymerase specialized sigma24 family protein
MANLSFVTKGQPRPRRRSDLTPAAFAVLLDALGGTAESAGARYERLRANLIFFFSRRVLTFPEDLADEVLDRLTKRLADGEKIVSMEAFALGIARYVAQEQSGRKDRTVTVDGKFWDNIPANLTTSSDEEEIRRLEDCLDRIPAAEATLLRRYYLSASENQIAARAALASDLGISSTTLRQRVFLARQRLRACLQEMIPSKGE